MNDDSDRGENCKKSSAKFQNFEIQPQKQAKGFF
jgi:hypothetical protein